MARKLADYANRYENIQFQRDQGVLEITLHTRGGPLEWGDSIHRDLPDAFYDVSSDGENRVVILTTAGDKWCDTVEAGSFILDPAVPPVDMDRIVSESKALFVNLLEIRVPIIAAFPGPATVHADFGLISDIVLASDTAFFQNQHFGNWSIVPGDGNHIIYPWLLGPNRGRYHLLTSKRWSSEEALAWGAVAEVVSASGLKARAREIALQLARKPILGLRYTREVLTLELRRVLHAYLGHGIALEGLSSGFGTWSGSTLHT